ncbi:MAG: BamA/TamA family outer membrane protein [Luteolibacter sp.]|jgi:outer membrane protein assembly factor BamA|nr:BamA/TamA family outer membrane protein [Luteolibacter sp.]
MSTLHVMLALLLAVQAASAETRVRITGMRKKSETQVLDLIGARLTHVWASPASAPLADDAAFILRRILRKDGYAEATVDWHISGRDEITLVVREGKRLSLGKVSVSGVPEEDARKFARLYASPAEKGRSFGSGEPPFREEDVETGLSYLRQELNARGHWSAEAALLQRAANPASGAVDLTIEVRPGPLHHIGRPAVTSVDGRGVKLVSGAVQSFTGRPASTANLNAMRLAAEELAVSRGYPDAIIRMGRSLGAATFVPLFSINLGTRVRLNQLHVAGLERTSPERITSRMKGMEGDWYDSDLMNKRLRELLATGAFNSARVETTPVGDRLVDATLHFDEARAREVSLGAGFGSYQGFITRATYADRNLFGKLWGFNSGFELGSRGLLGDVRVTNPWLYGTDVSAMVRAYALMYGREGYDVYETGLDGGIKWKFGDHYSLDLSAALSLVGLSEDGLPEAELGETDYTHPRLRITQTLDYRDSPVLPKRGWHLQIPLQIGAAAGDISTSYVMAGLSGGWFHEINRHYDIGIGGEWSMLVPSGDGGDLPIDLRLFNGGARSVRSFPERELGPAVNGFATGGEAMWNMNAELIRRISATIKAVAFFDAGSLARHHEDIGSANLELATGLGIRLDLPIGPVRFEYGYNLTRDHGEPAGTFHFAIGTAY